MGATAEHDDLLLTTVRIPESMCDRADALTLEPTVKQELAAHGKPTRSHVVRLATGIGLKSLERKAARAGRKAAAR